MSAIQLNSLYSIFTEFISVVTERQTYRNLLYLLITSIVGGIYFLGIFFGFTVSAILVFALIGIPLFAVLIIGARGAAAFERRLTNRLLETEIQSPDSEIDPRTEGLRPAFRELFISDTTWKGVGFLAIKGIIAFLLPVFALLGGFTAFALILAPVGEPMIWEVWTINTWIESMIAVPLGIALAVSMLHILNGLARVTGIMAESLLQT